MAAMRCQIRVFYPRIKVRRDACRKMLRPAANRRSCVSSSVKCWKFPRKAANRLSVSALPGIKTELRRQTRGIRTVRRVCVCCHGEGNVDSDQSGAF